MWLPVQAIELLQLEGAEAIPLIDEAQGQAPVVLQPAGAPLLIGAHRQPVAVSIGECSQTPLASLPAEMQEGRPRLGQDHLVICVAEIDSRRRQPVGRHGHPAGRQRQLDGEGFIIPPGQGLAVALESMSQGMTPASPHAAVQRHRRGAVEATKGKGQQAGQQRIFQRQQLLSCHHGDRAVVLAGLSLELTGLTGWRFGRCGHIRRAVDLLDFGMRLEFSLGGRRLLDLSQGLAIPHQIEIRLLGRIEFGHTGRQYLLGGLGMLGQIVLLGERDQRGHQVHHPIAVLGHGDGLGTITGRKAGAASQHHTDDDVYQHGGDHLGTKLGLLIRRQQLDPAHQGIGIEIKQRLILQHQHGRLHLGGTRLGHGGGIDAELGQFLGITHRIGQQFVDGLEIIPYPDQGFTNAAGCCQRMTAKSGTGRAVTAPGGLVFAVPLLSEPGFEIFLYRRIGCKQRIEIALLHIGVEGHPIGFARGELAYLGNALGIQAALLDHGLGHETRSGHVASFHLVRGVADGDEAHRLEQMNQVQSAAERALGHDRLGFTAAG
ncbi:hypothetical protein D3C79_480820 [compost metagenome]